MGSAKRSRNPSVWLTTIAEHLVPWLYTFSKYSLNKQMWELVNGEEAKGRAAPGLGPSHTCGATALWT